MKILLADVHLLFREGVHPIPCQAQVLTHRAALRVARQLESSGESHG
jgi:hypothetical protein